MDVDGLSSGDHNITIILTDEIGDTVSDTVMVKVIPPLTSTPPTMIMILVIIGGVSVVVVIMIIMIVRRRS